MTCAENNRYYVINYGRWTIPHIISLRMGCKIASNTLITYQGIYKNFTPRDTAILHSSKRLVLNSRYIMTLPRIESHVVEPLSDPRK